jgi:hypothetical protein
VNAKPGWRSSSPAAGRRSRSPSSGQRPISGTSRRSSPTTSSATGPGERTVRGAEQYMQALGELLALLADLRLEVPEHTMSPDGKFGFSRWVIHATGAKGPFELVGMDSTRVRDGRVLRELCRLRLGPVSRTRRRRVSRHPRNEERVGPTGATRRKSSPACSFGRVTPCCWGERPTRSLPPPGRPSQQRPGSARRGFVGSARKKVGSDAADQRS